MSARKPFPLVEFTQAEIDEIACERRKRRLPGTFNVEAHEYRASVRKFIREHFPIGTAFDLIGERVLVVDLDKIDGIGAYIGVIVLYKTPGGLAKTSISVNVLAALAGYEEPIPPWHFVDNLAEGSKL